MGKELRSGEGGFPRGSDVSFPRAWFRENRDRGIFYLTVEAFTAGDSYTSSSIYHSEPTTDQAIASAVRMVWRLQNDLDNIIPGLFNPLPDDDDNADAMRILSLAREMK